MFATSTRTAAVAVALALATTGTAAAAEQGAAPQGPAQAPVVKGQQGTPGKPKGAFRKALRKRSAKHQSLLKAGWIGPTCYTFRYSNRVEGLCQWDYIGYGRWVTYQEFWVNYGSGWRYVRSELRQ